MSDVLNLTSVGDGPDYRRDPKTMRFCVFCQRDLAVSAPGVRVVQILGGAFADTPTILRPGAVIPDRAYVAPYLLGPDCAKLIGLEWSVPERA